jgi:hypothetical protein
MSERPEWRLEYVEYTSSVIGDTLRRPNMTNGKCRVTTLFRPGPFAHGFKYEDEWRDIKIEFEFEAIFVGQSETTYQVFLGRALNERADYWDGSSRDNELLSHLMANIRQALCLLKSGYSEETRIRTVEFVLSKWPHWKTVSGFQSAEIVR